MVHSPLKNGPNIPKDFFKENLSLKKDFTVQIRNYKIKNSENFAN
jgi:hypothetical protein